MGKHRLSITFALVIITLWGCIPTRVISPPPPKPPSVPKAVEYGLASWYGREFHGKRTSGGDIYDMYELTAAHRTLPLGTVVMVTHRKNGRSVMAKINDRGPFVEGRIIDLSYAAAQSLRMIEEGVAPVKVEVLNRDGTRRLPVGGPFTIQVGSFVYRSNALRLMETLQKRYKDVYIATLETSENTYYRIRMGKFTTRGEAFKVAARLAKDGYTPLITETE